MKLIYKIFILIIPISFCLSCKDNNDIDVSNIKLNDIQIKRLDVDLFKIDTNSLTIDNEIKKLNERYPDFFKYYNYNIINIGRDDSPEYPKFLKKFINDPTIKIVKNAVSKKFHNLNNLEKEITLAFKHIRFYYPNIQLPKIYTYISGFNQKLAATDSAICISLDHYLGDTCKFYNMLNINQYQKKSKNPLNILPDIIRSFVLVNIKYKCKKDNVIGRMIEKGKINYFIGKILPNYYDDLIMGLTTLDIKICEENEPFIWETLVNKQLLFNSKSITIKQLTEPSPFTNAISRDAPGRTANWIGWQIVKQYANISKLPLSKIMEETDASKILNKSQYRP